LRTRFSVLGFGLCAAVLAACGGNGTPTPVPTNNSYRPAAAGDSFGYAGTMTESFVRPPLPAGAVTPSPNPVNSATLTTAVTQTVTVSTVATFQAVVNPFDFHVAETDVLDGGLKTSTITTDEFYVYAASGKSKTVTFAGSNSTTSDGVTVLDVTGTGNGLVDILPEVAGTIAPANNAARTTTETDPDGTTDVRTIAADGTYTDVGTYPGSGGVPATSSDAVANADGSGSYSFPIISTVLGGSPVGNASYTVTAPQPSTSTGPNQIDITATIPGVLTGNPNPSPTPLILTASVNVWYAQPLVLANETLVDNGAASLPAACNVPASLTRKPHQLADTKSSVDPVFGETDAQTTTTYTEPGIGVACVQLTDVLTQFYDLSGQTQGLLGFSGTPFQTTTTTETLGITAKTVRGLTSVGRTSQLELRAGIARFHAKLASRRLERHTAFQRALVARFQGSHR
jgi:hypothetical protein